ncbi:MAG: PQQ-binding-like beta-propeller repeat protein [Myxococcales bacterium]|nr:PQQ-binding-like beta-propeller repeat protein [Myxococcales bacterium]
MAYRSAEEALQRRVDRLVDDLRDRDREIAALKHRPRRTAEERWRIAVMALLATSVALVIVAAWVWRPTGEPPERTVLRWALPHTPAARAAPLVVSDVTGDGVEDFVGRFEGEAPRGRYVGLFDGATRRLRWRLGPYDLLNEPSQLGISAGRLVVVQGAALAVHRLSDGGLEQEREVKGEVIGICLPPDRQGPIWLLLAKEGHVLFHPADGTFTEAPKPAWCRNHGVELAPRIAGYETEIALEEDDRLIALARSIPEGGGVQAASLLGFVRGETATRWTRPLATDSPSAVKRIPRPGERAVLHEGRLVVAYHHPDSNKTRLEAVDAATGETLWLTHTPRDVGDSARALAVGEQHVLLAHDQMLSVFDVTTGELLATLGAPSDR